MTAVALSVVSRPPWVEKNVAWFVTGLAALLEGMWTTSVNTAELGPGISAILQLTVPLAPTAGVVHDQPPGEASETKVVLGGSGSVTVARSRVTAPLFEAGVVEGGVAPASTGFGEPGF